jgi:uncharacterized protein YndB with AHSA1/START domain
MQSDSQTASNPTWMSWIGWIISILPALALIASGSMKVMNIKPPEGSPDIGWSESAMHGLAIVEIGSAVLYLFPPTAVLGAIVMTGYLGGAVATHVRIGDPMIYPPIILGVLAWFGLLLRDARLRAILPWRHNPSVAPTGGFLAGFAKFVLTLGVIVGVLAALIEALPAPYRVSRSATMEAPPSKVFEQVNDLHKWHAWTPWLKHDPNAKVTIEEPSAGKGAIYKWSGDDHVGEGTMTLTESQPSERIKLKLDFVRPMPGKADAEFTFKADGDKTVVTWTITGEHNFLGKAFGVVMSMKKLSMDKMIGDNFEDGLAKMKAVVEGESKK